MRFLFSFTGGSGHFLPTEVFARALAHRGHHIRYTCQEAMVGTVSAAGWEVEPSGGASLLEPAARRALAPVDREGEERAMRDFFAGRTARERAHRLVELIEVHQPDLVVRDEVDFGAAIAADAVGVPHAAVAVIAAGRLTRPAVTETAVAALRSELGLSARNAWHTLHRYLLLVPVPPAFRDPEVPLPPTARHVRPAVLDPPPPAATTAPSVDTSVGFEQVGGARLPRVYFTLGTIFPQESGDLFQRVLAGLSALPVESVVTTGCAVTPAELGRPGPNVRIEQLLPLRETLAHSDAVVSHGGSGTVVSSLAVGLPQVVLPMGADQPDNADRCEDLGVGITLDAVTASPDDIAEAVTAVLDVPGYRLNARRIAEEARHLPGTDHAVSLLEAVARTGSPVTTLDP